MIDRKTNFTKENITGDSRRLIKVLREEKLPELVRRKKTPLIMSNHLPTPTGLYNTLHEETRMAY